MQAAKLAAIDTDSKIGAADRIFEQQSLMNYRETTDLSVLPNKSCIDASHPYSDTEETKYNIGS